MAKGPCERFTPDLSAYADGTLPPRRWEQVTYHLAGCQQCRDDVQAISQVCSTLSASRQSRTPESLTARLESIAGEHAATPLYMAPGSGELPSARRRRARRAAQGGVVLLAIMVSAVVIAVLVAPVPVTLTDPVKAAREQYSRSLAAISVNEAVGAMLLAKERGADFGPSERYEPRLSETQSLEISRELAANLLRRAAEVDLSLTGRQQVWASDGDGTYRTADVGTSKMQGYGAQLEVFDARGNLFSSSFLPAQGSRPAEAPWGWEYVRSATVEQIAGRDTIRIQANADGRPAAKWWVDAATGLMVWAERYNAAGEVTLAVGYQQLTLDDAPFHPDERAQLIALEPASSSQTADWCVGLEHCPQEVAGLSLVAYSSSGLESSPAMNLVYSDGFHTAVVGWKQGVLGEGELSVSDVASGVAVEVWQADDAVLSVTCDCPPALLQDIAGELPGEAEYRPSLAEKIADGLARLTKVG